MELVLTPEQEVHLIQIAEHEGKTPSQFVADTMATVLEADRNFRKRVQLGLDQANEGQFIEEEEMDSRFEKMTRG